MTSQLRACASSQSRKIKAQTPASPNSCLCYNPKDSELVRPPARAVSCSSCDAVAVSSPIPPVKCSFNFRVQTPSICRHHHLSPSSSTHYLGNPPYPPPALIFFLATLLPPFPVVPPPATPAVLPPPTPPFPNPNPAPGAPGPCCISSSSLRSLQAGSRVFCVAF